MSATASPEPSGGDGSAGGVVIGESSRLIVSRLRPCDSDVILGVFNTPAFLAFVADRGMRTVDQALQVEDGGVPAGTRVGISGLIYRPTIDETDLGYALLPDRYGRGYATEAGACVLSFARAHLPLTRVVGLVQAANKPSVHVLEKLGFVREKPVCLYEGQPSCELYALAL